MLMPDVGNKSAVMSKTAYLEIKEAEDVLCSGGPTPTSKQAQPCVLFFVSCVEP